MGGSAGRPLINTTGISFKYASSEDIPVIYSYAKDLIDRYEDISSLPYRDVLDWMRKKIEDNIDQYQCVFADGVKVAYFRLDDSRDEAEIDDVYVVPEYRGRGIGTALIKYCFTQTCKPIFLYVFRRNVGAIRLYTRMGFRISEIVGNTRLIMRYGG